ncbi:MAG: flagellar biosynthesis protein FlhB [Beijerinckiaceae bacterium]
MAEGQDHEDKTEEPTQRRIEDAIKKGDVAKSQEINTLFVFGGLALAMMMFGASSAREVLFAMKPFLGNMHQIPSDAGGIRYALQTVLFATLAAVALPFVIMTIFGMAGGMVQHQPLWTTEPLTPKGDRISPLAGFKRVFGKQAFVQFLKGLFKLAIVGVAVWVVLDSERDRADALARMDVVQIMPAMQTLALKLIGTVMAVFAFLAGGDYLYQRVTWHKRLRMTKEELKQEYKEQEGTPEIKQKRKQIAHERMKKRMMAAVPQATVVVMNPTHFAVALKYEKGMGAPICVAKGVDSLALRIRDIARENGVTVIQNPPLARALHAKVAIDEEIPVEHYKAVAELIGYVLRLKRRAS